MANEVATYLKYANLQIAAEASYGKETAPVGEIYIGPLTVDNLTKGNARSSKFTPAAATEFAANWTVVEHKSNTGTGFSGTLFKYTGPTDVAKGLTNGELVISFRSTEFADDAARDNQATNNLEIKEKGWAFGQIADMESWFSTLKQSGKIGTTDHYSVTGYSLGGHLATAFNLLRQQDGTSSQITSTYTFNGAGVGNVTSGNLTQVMQTFKDIRSSGAASQFSTTGGLTLYQQLKSSLSAHPSSGALGAARNQIIVAVAGEPNGATYEQTIAEYNLMLKAIERAKSVADERDRVAVISNTGLPPLPTNLQDIDAVGLDYQLAVLTASKNTKAYPVSDLTDPESGIYSTLFDRRNVALNPIANFYDVYASNRPSAVANSQLHYGTVTPVRVEDQPLHRGSYVAGVLGSSMLNWDIKLIGNNFSENDFGDTHSLVLIVDSLSVQNALAQLDPNFTGTQWSTLMDIASFHKGKTQILSQGEAEGDALENIVNSLVDAFALKGAAGITRLKGDSNGGTWAEVDYKNGNTGRSALQETLATLMKLPAYKDLAGQVLVRPSSSDLRANARGNFGATVALQDLSSFYLTGKDATAQLVLDAAWSSTRATEYTDWLADKSSPAPTNYTDKWITDRAAMLGVWNERNQKNIAAGSPILGTTNAIYEDKATGQTLTVSGPVSPTVYTTKMVFGANDASGTETLDGNAGDDRLYGMAGTDTLNGQGGDDYLEGGSGLDTYTFTTGSGKDTILDSDGKGTLTLSGVALTGGKYDTQLRTWAQVVGADTYVYEVRTSGTTNQLVIHKKDDTAYTNSITINNFDVAKANSPEGYLGIKFDSAAKLALNDEPGVNYWATHTDTSSLVGKGSTAVEGGGELLALSLGTPAKANDTITFAMGGYAQDFDLIIGDARIPANGAVITLNEGQTDVRVSLVHKGEVSADINTTVTATYKSIDPQGPPEAVSNTWAITVKDAGVASNTFTGDQHPQLDASNQYKWNETTWAADGTLVNGVVEPGFNDVLVGTTGADKIFGIGGNDALGGGDGSDQMDGGDGDDLIAGGNGSDTIKGGAGNDHIFSSANLQLGSGIRQVGLRVSSGDTWTMPVGDTLWKKGSTWGISQDAQGLVVFPFSKLTLPDAAPDVIEAGDGNDEVVAGLGDDRIDGGLGNDALTGAGGADVVDGSDGSDGSDFIQGDGDNNPVSLLYTAVANHGNDFLDGGLGDDTLYGGADDDVNLCLHLSPVCGIASGRYACYRGPRLHRGRHTQPTRATKRIPKKCAKRQP